MQDGEALHRQRRRLARAVRDAVWRMQRPEELEPALATLRDGLFGLDLPVHDCAVHLVDRRQSPPAIRQHPMTRAGAWQPLTPEAADVVRRIHESGEVACRADLGTEDPFAEASQHRGVACVLDIPFSHGTLRITSRRARAFDAEAVDLLAEMAALIEDGVRRRDEIRRTQACVAVRDKVWQMRDSDDIEEVLVALREAFDELGFRYNACGLNLVSYDEQAAVHVVMWHNMTHGGDWLTLGREPLPLVVEFWRRGVPAYRPDLSVEDAHGERASISDYYGRPPRAVIDVPFSHGTLALNSTEPNAFDDDEVELLRELAGVLEGGFRRLDDLKALEERNRVLEEEVDERRRAEDGLARTLREKEALLREVHHRVKNNMQVVSSLLSLRAGRLDEGDGASSFEDSRAQIQSMAFIHERLYEAGDLNRISGAAFLRDLAARVLASYGVGGRVRLVAESDEEAITAETAIETGLIVHELVTNSLKHAFPGQRQGTIHLEARMQTADRVRLRVRDDGVGLPAGFDARGTLGTLGLSLVADLTEKLHGTWSIETDAGVRVEVCFPLRPRT